MDKNYKTHLHYILGITFIISGILSLIYGFIIPTQGLPKNVIVSLAFEIIGIVLIIIALILFFLYFKKDYNNPKLFNKF